MAKLRFTWKAVEDLTAIWNYTAEKWSEEQADKYYRSLITCCRTVAENPKLHTHKYDEIAADLYGVRSGRHILFYRIAEDDAIEVIRILHERMDLKSKFVQ